MILISINYHKKRAKEKRKKGMYDIWLVRNFASIMSLYIYVYMDIIIKQRFAEETNSTHNFVTTEFSWLQNKQLNCVSNFCLILKFDA